MVKPKKHDFVLVEFDGEKGSCYYMERVSEEITNFKFEISFMRKNPKNWTFYFPQIADNTVISRKEIKMISETSNFGTTECQKRFISFNLNFSLYNIDLR